MTSMRCGELLALRAATSTWTPARSACLVHRIDDRVVARSAAIVATSNSITHALHDLADPSTSRGFWPFTFTRPTDRRMPLRRAATFTYSDVAG